jgi:hypothetical protein
MSYSRIPPRIGGIDTQQCKRITRKKTESPHNAIIVVVVVEYYYFLIIIIVGVLESYP